MTTPSTLGIIAGSGDLPIQMVEACQRQQRDVFILGFEGTTDMQHYAHLPHAQVRLGAIGEAIAQLRGAGANDIVMAGSIKRPSWSGLRPDAAGAKLMAKLGTRLFSGDDALLKGILSFLEEEGFTVLSTEDILGDSITPEGVLGKHKPDKQASADIAHGIQVAKTLGALDVGQAVIIEHGYVLGVEAAEGTDALIARCAGLKREAKGGVLVKVKKPAQEDRADLPTIGIQTIDYIHKAGFAGIAIEAGGSILLNQTQMIARADALKLFIVGCVSDE